MDRKGFKKYIFTQKLRGECVCVVWDRMNGFYSDLLEECGIWSDTNKKDELVFVVHYPLYLRTHNQSWELSKGDIFTAVGKQ